MVQHIHGTFEYDVWIPARSQTFNKETREHDIKDYDEYEIMLTNDDNGFKIRNKITNRVLKHCNSKQGDNVVTFSVNNVHTCALVTHVMLISAFPDVAPSETVDHIDNIHTNNNITNLQWMSYPEIAARLLSLRKKVLRLPCRSQPTRNGAIFLLTMVKPYTKYQTMVVFNGQPALKLSVLKAVIVKFER